MVREPAILAMAPASVQGVSQSDVDDIALGIADPVYGECLIEYVIETLDVTDEQITAAVRRNAPEKAEEAMATLADRWKAEGRAETLVVLLKRKFGTILRPGWNKLDRRDWRI